ncbi:MAG: AAA family ATPase [Clostridia bacterium]|nr:AAA family ATPase [Clostridia bacterium]
MDNERMFEVTIKEAKEELKRICSTYLKKNTDESFVIPFNRQRPVMLLGPAGIGKTDIPKQAAEEMGIGFLSYSITHHTRQSLLGLPKIISKNYGKDEALVTEYTTSEIIAAVNDEIENSGKSEGILFIDEVNCASETLTAPLLQLYQNKTLGKSSLAEGWILVLAGNPGEYNRSAKEFDAVTRDRMRVINVRPDSSVWLEYAEKRKLNPSVISYVAMEKDNFYRFDEDESIVTPRGWEELSINLDLYEKDDYEITKAFIYQFISSQAVVMDFYNHYNLTKKAVSEQDLESILSGKTDKNLIKRMKDMTKSIRFAFTVLISRSLRLKIETDLDNAGEYFENVMSFFEKAFPGEDEQELFMSRVLTEPEIVTAAIKNRNKKFLEYLSATANADAEINKLIKKAEAV